MDLRLGPFELDPLCDIVSAGMWKDSNPRLRETGKKTDVHLIEDSTGGSTFSFYPAVLASKPGSRGTLCVQSSSIATKVEKGDLNAAQHLSSASNQMQLF